MQKILRKRIGRDLKTNAFRYTALALLIIFCMYLIVSMVGAAETIITNVDENAKKMKLEEGQFSVFAQLSENQMKELTDLGITVNEQFSLDFKEDDGSIVRVFKNREEINQITVDEGRIANQENEAVIEKQYASRNEINVGDHFTVDGQNLEIVGIGSAVDYDAPYNSVTDTCVDSKNFGLIFVNEKEYDILKNSKHSMKAEDYSYAYLKNDKLSDDQLEDKITELLEAEGQQTQNMLTNFMPADDNPRIKASSNDQVVNRYAGLAAGVIVMVLFTYVISVFVIHGIEKESSVIGALYALGVRKRDLVIHYLTLPVIITFVSGAIGTAIGLSKLGVNVQMQNCYDYFSIPEFSVVIPAYLLVYGLIMPAVVSAFVNYLVINKKLSQPALKMIRNEQKAGRFGKIKLGNMGFVNRFRIRQMLREIRSSFTVVFGMFISLLIVMLALDCYVMCDYISTQNKSDAKFEYMYTYKFPDEKIPEGGTAAYAKSFSKENLGYNLDVTLLGIESGNPYFDVDLPAGTDEVVISSSVSEKFGLKKGDLLVMKDKETKEEKTFKVKGIYEYSVGLNVFMDLNSMRQAYEVEDSYFNVVFADKKLSINADLIYSILTKEDIVKSADIFINSMRAMVIMLTVVSIVVFCVVMYLMMNVMIDRSAFSISLIKIFGYRMKEIRKLYLNGNFYMVAVGALICIPLSKLAMDKIYPLLVSNVGVGMHLDFSWQLYGVLYVGILLLYQGINAFLVGKVKKMVPAEVLKNRE